MKIAQIITALILACSVVSHVHSQEEKVYLETNQIHIENNHISIDVNGQKHKVEAIYSDILGLYVLSMQEPTAEYSIPYCKYGHPSPNNDGYCYFPGCPFNR